MVDKQAVLAAVIANLERQIASARTLVSHAQEAATHDEARAEDKYDTRGLEMSYVAAGATDRIEELRRVLSQYHFWQLPAGGLEVVRPGALVELTDGPAQMLVFVAPHGEGAKVTVEGHTVHVVTLAAPLGRALAGREEGDEVRVAVAGHQRRWQVASVC